MQARTLQNEPLWRQAELYASRKAWPQAAACFRALLRDHPDDSSVLLQLSYIESLAGHYRSAREYALRAYRSVTRSPAIVPELIARLRTFNEAELVHKTVAALRPLNKVPIPVLLACANQLSSLNRQESALQLLDEAKRGDPDYPPTLLARSQVLTYLGRFDAAEAELLRCLQRAPEIATTYWLLSRLRKQTAETNRIDQIRRQLRRPGRQPEEVVLLAYALHKELDDLGDYPQAWCALELACRTKRATLSYSHESTVDLVTRLIDLFPIAGRRQAMPQEVEGPVPIFIVGMHRSGTTLLEQCLHGNSAVAGLGELYDFTSQMRLATDHHCRGVIDRRIVERAPAVDFAAVGRGYLAGLAWRLDGEKFFTDKLPSNFLNLGFICRALPRAKILHMKRDPVQTCFSNLRELFSGANPYSYDQAELAGFYRQYERLMAHWREAFPGRILDVDYAQLVGSHEQTLRKVADFCGFALEPAMMHTGRQTRAVSTASAVAVRNEVVAPVVEKWVPYADELRPLRDGLDAR